MDESRIPLLRLLRSLTAAVNRSEDGEQAARACLRGVCERTRQALRESETRFRTVAEAASDAIVSIDAGGRIVFWNAAAERSFGYPAPEVVGRTLEVILPERYREAHARELRRVLATGESKLIGRPVEVHGLRRNGTEFPVELSLSSWTAEGQTFFTGILRDVTDRTRKEELARLVEERTAEIRREKDFSQRLVESGAQGILAFDRECRYTVWNPAMERLTGMSKERVLGHAAFGLFPFLRETPVFGAYAEALAGRSNRVEETPYTIPQTGRAGFFEARYSPLVGEGGEIVGGLGIVEDVTSRRAAQVALRNAELARGESEDRFRATADTAPVMVWVCEPDGRCIFVNKTWLDFTGRRLEQELGYGWAESVHPEDRERCLRSYETALAVRRPYREEYRGRRADGEYRWLLATSAPRHDPGGEFAGFVGSCIDITDRRAAEDALRESESRFRLIADSAPVMLWMAGTDGRPTFYNRSCLEFTGRTAEGAAEAWVESVHPEDFDAIMATYWAAFQSREPFRKEYRLRRHDGEYRWVLETGVPRFDAAGTFEGYVGSSLDITDRKTAEQGLQESEERFRQMAENVSAVFWMMQVRTRDLLYVSPGYEQVWGRTVESLLAEPRSFAETIHPEDRRPAAARFARMDREPCEAEYRIRRPDGAVRWIRNRSFPVRGPGGGTDRVVGVAEDVTERKLRELEREAIVAVASALRAAATAAEMLPVVLDQVADLLKAECSAVVLRDEDSGELMLELGRGGWASMTGMRELGGDTLSAAVIASGQPFLDNAVSENPRLAGHRAMAGITAAACVPLISQQQTLGALWIGRRTPIQKDELRLLVAIAEMMANALRRSSLHEQTERRLRQITALRAGELAISSSLDLGLTLSMLLEQITMLLGVDASAVLLLNEHTRALEYAAGRGFRTSAYLRTRLRVGQGLPGRAVLERQRRFVPDLSRVEGGLQRGWLVFEEGFTSYLAVPLVAKGVVKGVLELLHRSALATTAEWLDLVDTLALQASLAIDNATMFDEVNRSNLELAIAYDTTLEGWSRTLELRDEETEGHTARVTEVTVRLARTLGMRGDEIVHLRRGALLHDIGKMAIPDRILLKPGALDEEEWRVMRLHPVYALDALSPIPFLRSALDIPHYHHERWDGTGYPRGLRAEEIPLAARIFAVVDVWDALRSDRPYRPAWPEERVREHIRREAGTHFDPRMVELFLRETAQDRSEPRAPAPKGLEKIAAFGSPAARH